MKMPLTAIFTSLGIGLAVVASGAQASVINGGFDTGNLAGWTPFTTSNGTLGDFPLPRIAMFDVDGDSLTSNSLKLSVGYNIAPCSFPGFGCPLPIEGGGIRQSIFLSRGTYLFSADLAVENTTLYGGFNRDGGTFSLMLDGIVLDTVSVGEVLAGFVQGSALTFNGFVEEGLHDFQVRVTRNSAQSDSLFQYVDNIAVARIPEPGTLGLLALGCVFLASGLGRRVAKPIA
jgi:hypothetical protein